MSDSMYDAGVFEVNLDSGDSVLTAEGEYQARCVGIKKQQSKSSGNPMWVFTFRITNGQFKGAELPMFVAITPASLWKVAETLGALGVASSGSVKFTANDVVGKPCTVRVGHFSGERGTMASVQGVTALAAGVQDNDDLSF